MASRGNAEVAYYDEAEATSEKTPQTYDGFTYDNATDGGILALFEEVKQKLSTVKSDVETLHGEYGKLQNLYDEFTNFNETMDKIIKTMNSNVDNIDKYFNGIVDTARQAVEEHQKTDETLMSDLEQLNEMLGIDNGPDYSQSGASFISGAR